jgi:hypothetical protein
MKQVERQITSVNTYIRQLNYDLNPFVFHLGWTHLL